MDDLETPVLDDHLHLDPAHGRGVDAVEEFARLGGTHLLVVNRTSWHHGVEADTGTLLYTKNTALDRNEESGDLSPAKEFSLGSGLLKYVVRARNGIAAMEFESSVPTGYEADAKCEYCF